MQELSVAICRTMDHYLIRGRYNVTTVVVEQQKTYLGGPIQNINMALFTYFTLLYPECTILQVQPNTKFPKDLLDAQKQKKTGPKKKKGRSKRRLREAEEIEESENTDSSGTEPTQYSLYKDRKDMAVGLCEDLLIQAREENALAYLNSFGKKDDLADSYLLARLAL